MKRRGHKQLDIYKSIRKDVPKPTIKHVGRTRRQERHQVKEDLRKYKGKINGEVDW